MQEKGAPRAAGRTMFQFKFSTGSWPKTPSEDVNIQKSFCDLATAFLTEEDQIEEAVEGLTFERKPMENLKLPPQED